MLCRNSSIDAAYVIDSLYCSLLVEGYLNLIEYVSNTVQHAPCSVAYTVSAEFALYTIARYATVKTLCSNCDQSVYATVSI